MEGWKIHGNCDGQDFRDCFRKQECETVSHFDKVVSEWEDWEIPLPLILETFQFISVWTLQSIQKAIANSAQEVFLVCYLQNVTAKITLYSLLPIEVLPVQGLMPTDAKNGNGTTKNMFNHFFYVTIILKSYYKIRVLGFISGGDTMNIVVRNQL